MILEWLGRGVRWLARRLGGLNLVYISLLILSLGSMATGLAAMMRDITVRAALLTVLCGALLSWLLARSRLKGWAAALIAVPAGVPVLLLVTGGMGAPLWALLSAAALVCIQFLRRQPADTPALAEAWNAAGASLGMVWTRLGNWSRMIGGEVIAADPLAVGLFWGAVLWLIALWAAWLVRRREAVLLGLLPGAALLVYNVYYTNSRAGLPWILLLGATIIALQAVQTFGTARLRWQAARLDQAEVEPTLAASVAALTLALVVFGALLPSISIPKMVEQVNEMFEARDDRLAESLGLEQTPQAAGRGAGSIITGSHMVGAGPRLSNQVVMYVTVDGYEPVPETARIHGEVPEDPVRYYWRSQTFDLYTGRGWSASTGRGEELPASQPLYPDLVPQPEIYLPITQHVRRVDQGQAVLVTGELLSLDQQAVIAWHAADDFANAQSGATSYTAQSRVPIVAVEQLQAAGTAYPPEVLERYLQLPDNFPVRVRDLAFEITAGQLTPFDRASAIEEYLRQYPYSLDVPAPPLGRDVADFFLFDLQEGYCDYYATTMAVMARSIGIPSRLVLGYARGFYEEGNGRFVVRENHSHAWVEIYFPGYGWIEFEPTSNQPRINRPRNLEFVSAAELAASQPGLEPESAVVQWWQKLDIPNTWLWAGLAVLLAGLSIPMEGWLLRLQTPEAALHTIYRRLYRLGGRWNLPGAGALTAHEFAAALSARLEPFATGRLSRGIAAIRRDLEWLTRLYVRSLYAAQAPSRPEGRQAVRLWLGLKRRIWWLRLQLWRNG